MQTKKKRSPWKEEEVLYGTDFKPLRATVLGYLQFSITKASSHLNAGYQSSDQSEK